MGANKRHSDGNRCKGENLRLTDGISPARDFLLPSEGTVATKLRRLEEEHCGGARYHDRICVERVVEASASTARLGLLRGPADHQPHVVLPTKYSKIGGAFLPRRFPRTEKIGW